VSSLPFDDPVPPELSESSRLAKHLGHNVPMSRARNYDVEEEEEDEEAEDEDEEAGRF
jgi:hypothetical protein